MPTALLAAPEELPVEAGAARRHKLCERHPDGPYESYVKKRAGPDKGRRFWKCGATGWFKTQCPFFAWDQEPAVAAPCVDSALRTSLPLATETTIREREPTPAAPAAAPQAAPPPRVLRTPQAAPPAPRTKRPHAAPPPPLPQHAAPPPPLPQHAATTPPPPPPLPQQTLPFPASRGPTATAATTFAPTATIAPTTIPLAPTTPLPPAHGAHLAATAMNALGLGPIIESNYEQRGITQLFDWQAKALGGKGVLDGSSNLLYTAPTSGGKTLVAEILMLRRIVAACRASDRVRPPVSIPRLCVTSVAHPQTGGSRLASAEREGAVCRAAQGARRGEGRLLRDAARRQRAGRAEVHARLRRASDASRDARGGVHKREGVDHHSIDGSGYARLRSAPLELGPLHVSRLDGAIPPRADRPSGRRSSHPR